MLTIQVQGLDTVQNQLRRLAERGANPTPLLKNMGEQVLNSTQERFESSTDPDGNRWASNSPVTFARLLGSRHTDKNGQINARGVSRVISKKPLILSHTLQGSIRYQLNGQSVMVGTNLVYAKMMHFGGTKSAFPHLWGDIPARPFLGISSTDKQVLKQMVVDYWRNII
ncbi:MAG: phage virion morphogenesis protein [Moraxella sp.]|nr:phage virion morphogenesis protein [Moraxella sp.]